MAVYVGQLFPTAGYSASWPYEEASHMFADTEEELHDMASRIGLKRKWAQNMENKKLTHYDLTASKRRAAIKHGAEPITRSQEGNMIRDHHKKIRRPRFQHSEEDD